MQPNPNDPNFSRQFQQMNLNPGQRPRKSLFKTALMRPAIPRPRPQPGPNMSLSQQPPQFNQPAQFMDQRPQFAQQPSQFHQQSTPQFNQQPPQFHQQSTPQFNQQPTQFHQQSTPQFNQQPPQLGQPGPPVPQTPQFSPHGPQPPQFVAQPPQFANQPPQFAVQPPQFANQQPPQFANQQNINQIQPPQFGAPRPLSQQNSFISSGATTPSLAPSQPQRKIDPDMIPSPIAVMQLDAENHAASPWGTMNRTINPPLASTRYTSYDEGSAGPRYIRSTTYQLACNDELAKTSSIPIGLVIQPLADPGPNEPALPLINAAPIRCGRCKVSPEYFCNLDMSGRRLDIASRPELYLGSVEWTATPEYCSRPPSPCTYLIAIDVSHASLQNGMLVQVADAIRQFLYGPPTPIAPLSGNSLPPGTRIGIMTFDSLLHFYNLTPNLDTPQMIIQPDTTEVFCPLHAGLFVDPIQSRTVIEALLDALPTLFVGEASSVLGAAAQACLEALKEKGGKLLVFQSILPTSGPGALSVRDEAKLIGTDKERQLYEPADYFWRKLGQDFAVSGICVDLFLCPSAYIDVASIGCLASLSGGEIYTYPNFTSISHGVGLVNDLHRSLSKTFGYDGLLRVRTSPNLKIIEHFGNFYMRNSTDVEIAGISSHSTLAVLLKHDGKLDEKQEIALLYTSSTGERRVRIHTTSLLNTSLISTLFRCAELDATINFLSKAAVAQSATSTLKEIRDQLTEKCCAILGSYRKHCASVSSSGQLILPESFKLYPIYSLALLKNAAFRSGEMSSDARVFHMRLLKSLSVEDSIALFYPRLLSLHDLDLNGDAFDADGRVILPPFIRVSYERLDVDGVYLIGLCVFT